MAGCLSVGKKGGGDEGGVGEDSIFRTEGTQWRKGGFPKCLEIPELSVGQGDGSTVRDPCLLGWGVCGCEGVGSSERALGEREGGRESRLGAQGGPGASGSARK